MTNDEAIEILDSVGEGRTEEDWHTALDVGIKALENQERMQREITKNARAEAPAFRHGEVSRASFLFINTYLLDGIAEMCDRLEKALAMACELVPKSDWCYTKEHVCDKRGCTMCMIGYFKKKAGIDES